jgi:hypothetical protein
MKKILLLHIGGLVILSLAFTACQKVNELADTFKNHKNDDEGISFMP